jgi:hypothetical protein
MQRPEHIQRFEKALHSTNAVAELRQLAISLRDEGVTQIEVYFLFERFLIPTSADDPKYDAITETMDSIWGGAWAKGSDIFPTELSNEAVWASREAQDETE